MADLADAAQALLDAEEAMTANADPTADEAVIERFYRAKVALRAALAAAPPTPCDEAWLRDRVAEVLDDYLPDAVAYQWAQPAAAELVHRLPHVFAGQLTASAVKDALDEAKRTTGVAVDHAQLQALADGMATLLAAAPPDDEPAKRWTYEVNYEGGSQPTDYGTGTEWDGSHYWVIYDGPSEIDDVVLVGMAAEDPTEVVAEIVAVHNGRAAAGSPPPTNGPTPETIAQAFHEAYERLAPSFGYETRKASAVPWPDVPENNRRLMTAVAGEVMALWAPYVHHLAEALDQAQLRSIEAHNPGIDMDEVRRIRGGTHRPDNDPEET